jgi:hypothetical protein
MTIFKRLFSSYTVKTEYTVHANSEMWKYFDEAFVAMDKVYKELEKETSKPPTSNGEEKEG